MGVTVNLAVTGIFDTVVAVNAGILPVPAEVPSPIVFKVEDH
jgi:hypothetical protein